MVAIPGKSARVEIQLIYHYTPTTMMKDDIFRLQGQAMGAPLKPLSIFQHWRSVGF